ncbi:Arc family DNA-binding protein [Stenotrophomonas indicatrix]|uniref:Arc family DNA-binding protein n=1 Tax=Stenotrophomonas indicatrix TaxID=2045451 RepID=UPI00300A6CF4
MSQTDPIKSQLRIPAALHQRLLDETARSGRSMNAEIVHRLEGSFQSAGLTQGLLRSQLLNFQLATDLLKHNPRMITVVGKLISDLFDNDEIRGAVFAMADSGDETAVMARDTMMNKLPAILEGVQAKMESIIEKGDSRA